MLREFLCVAMYMYMAAPFPAHLRPCLDPAT